MFIKNKFIIFSFFIISSCTNFKKDNVSTLQNINSPDYKYIEYSKNELAKNILLFEQVRQECLHMERKHDSESCHNIVNLYVEIYKQEAELNRRRSTKK